MISSPAGSFRLRRPKARCAQVGRRSDSTGRCRPSSACVWSNFGHLSPFLPKNLIILSNFICFLYIVILIKFLVFKILRFNNIFVEICNKFGKIREKWKKPESLLGRERLETLFAQRPNWPFALLKAKGFPVLEFRLGQCSYRFFNLFFVLWRIFPKK